jgi:hypothetical protein
VRLVSRHLEADLRTLVHSKSEVNCLIAIDSELRISNSALASDEICFFTRGNRYVVIAM